MPIETFQNQSNFTSQLTAASVNVTTQLLSANVDVLNIISSSINNSSVYTTVSANSAKWSSAYSTVTANSANWTSSYTTVSANSAKWSSAYSTVTANSANWNNNYTTVNLNSASWVGGNSAFTTLNSNSANWITESALTNVRINSVGGTFNNPVANDLIYIPCVYSGSIAAYTIQLIGTGTCTIKTWKKASGSTNPTISDSISTSGVSLTSGNVIRSTNVSDFTNTTINANDLLTFQMASVSGSPTQVIFVIQVNKT